MSAAPNDPGIPVLTEKLDPRHSDADGSINSDSGGHFLLPDSALALPDEPEFSWPSVIDPSTIQKAPSGILDTASPVFDLTPQNLDKTAGPLPSKTEADFPQDLQFHRPGAPRPSSLELERRIWATLEARLADTLDTRLEHSLAKAVDQALADAIDELKLNLRETARQLILEAVRSELKHSLPFQSSSDIE